MTKSNMITIFGEHENVMNRIIFFEQLDFTGFRMNDVMNRVGPYIYAYRLNVGTVRWNYLTDKIDFIPSPVVISDKLYKTEKSLRRQINRLRSRFYDADLYRKLSNQLFYVTELMFIKDNKFIVVLFENLSLWFQPGFFGQPCDLWVVYDFNTLDTYGLFIRTASGNRRKSKGLYILPSDPAISEAQFKESFRCIELTHPVQDLYVSVAGKRDNKLIIQYYSESERYQAEFSYEPKRDGKASFLGEYYGPPGSRACLAFLWEDFSVHSFNYGLLYLGSSPYKLVIPEFLDQNLHVSFFKFLPDKEEFIVKVIPRSAAFGKYITPLYFLVSLDDFRKYRENVLYYSKIINEKLPDWVQENKELYSYWMPHYYILDSCFMKYGLFDDLFNRVGVV